MTPQEHIAALEALCDYVMQECGRVARALEELVRVAPDSAARDNAIETLHLFYQNDW